MYKVLFFPLFLLMMAFSFSGEKKSYPQDYFRSPVDYTILLSGTFGELRPNHFHAGIDIKGAIGKPLYSIADGYVSRIKVQSGGYGQVLYIDHPNGYTSVYAHMHRFDKTIEKYVKEQQYQQQSFEVDLYPAQNQFVFKKGQLIGKMGTTGRSFGPHLHFEIRDTQTEKPINPLLFGFAVNDKIPPKLHQLKIYSLNDKHETIATKTKNISKAKSGKYYIGGDTLYIPAWRVGLGLKTYDHMNGVSNWNGVYSIEMFEEEQSKYMFEMETFAFHETRYINAHLDYNEQVAKKSYFNRCYRLPGNQLQTYPIQSEDGVITLSQNKAKKIKMVVKDADGNTTNLTFYLKRAKEVKKQDQDIYNYYLPYNEDNIIQNEDIVINLPYGSLYENLYLQYHKTNEKSADIYSDYHHIQDFKTPTHKYYELGIKAKNLPTEKRDKAVIVYCRTGKAPLSYGGKWEGDFLKTEVRDFGDFCIMLDEKPPSIIPISFKSNMKGFNLMSFKIKDNFKTARNVKGLSYNGYIDGEWVLFEFDAKKNLIKHRFDKNLPSGKHQFKLIVEDERGNKKVFKRDFTR